MADRGAHRTRDHRTRAPVHLQHRHALNSLALKPCRLQERVSLAWHCRLCGQTNMFSPGDGRVDCGIAPETLHAIARDIEERYPMKHFLKLLADLERSRPIARIQLSDRQGCRSCLHSHRAVTARPAADASVLMVRSWHWMLLRRLWCICLHQVRQAVPAVQGVREKHAAKRSSTVRYVIGRAHGRAQNSRSS